MSRNITNIFHPSKYHCSDPSTPDLPLSSWEFHGIPEWYDRYGKQSSPVFDDPNGPVPFFFK